MTENMTPAQGEPREESIEAPQTVTLSSSEEVASEPTQVLAFESTEALPMQRTQILASKSTQVLSSESTRLLDAEPSTQMLEAGQATQILGGEEAETSPLNADAAQPSSEVPTATTVLGAAAQTQAAANDDSQVWSAQSAASDAATTSDEAPKQIRFLTLIWGLVLAATGLWGILLACGVGISAIAAAATIFAGAGILLLIAALRGIRKPAVVDTAETATVH